MRFHVITYLVRLVVEPVMSVLSVINEQRAYAWLNALLLGVWVGAAVTAVLWGGGRHSCPADVRYYRSPGPTGLGCMGHHSAEPNGRDGQAAGGNPAVLTPARCYTWPIR